MQRWALGLEYDGTPFVGWQWQRNGHSIQAEVEAALSHVAGHPVGTHCAGRTDRGVHALGQVIHFDTQAVRNTRNWLLGLNTRLPDSIAVIWACPVSDRFHARFEAQARRYRYIIANQSLRPALDAQRVSWCRYPLDAMLMHEAAQSLRGEHDFTSLRAKACQAKSPIKRIHSISVQRHGRHIILDVHANAFLHHMVRNIAGVLIAIGRGQQSPEWINAVLASRDRRHPGITAPATGLYFVGADYDPSFNLPNSATQGPIWPLLP